MTAKKILIADDHQVIRTGLKQILSTMFTEVEFGEVGNGSDVFSKLKEKEWNILILDNNMPGKTGLEVLKQLKDEKINTPVLMLSLLPEEIFAVRALKLGARGYLSKETVDVELVKAVTEILNGKKYITASVAEQLLTQIDNPQNKPPHEMLSEREFQTFLLIGAGKSISQVAEDLSLSITTVSTYRTRILEKMNMKSNAELISYVIHNNLA